MRARLSFCSTMHAFMQTFPRKREEVYLPFFASPPETSSSSLYMRICPLWAVGFPPVLRCPGPPFSSGCVFLDVLSVSVVCPSDRWGNRPCHRCDQRDCRVPTGEEAERDEEETKRLRETRTAFPVASLSEPRKPRRCLWNGGYSCAYTRLLVFLLSGRGRRAENIRRHLIRVERTRRKPTAWNPRRFNELLSEARRSYGYAGNQGYEL